MDLYGSPWVERQCRCPDGRTCPSSLHGDDGHTIVDKTRQYKLCEPVKRLPICRYFKLVAIVRLIESIHQVAERSNVPIRECFTRLHRYTRVSYTRWPFTVYRDVTWTLAPGGGPANATVQRVYCRCRPGSVPYLVRRQAYRSSEGNPGFIYAFACSPQSVSLFHSSVFAFVLAYAFPFPLPYVVNIHMYGIFIRYKLTVRARDTEF